MDRWTAKSQYINISTFRPLIGSSYVKLSLEWRSPKKGIINIKNKDQKYFLWCHVRHINPVKIDPERITQKDKEFINDLNYDVIEFPGSEKSFSKFETKNNICINVFCYENKLTFPIYISDQKFENSVHSLLIINENKSHYVYIKDFDRFMFHKTKNINKKYFCKTCLQCFSSKNVLTEHKEVCLSINGAQSVKLEKGTIEFKNIFKQIQVPFKIYSDFGCILKNVESYEVSCLKKYQDHVTCSFTYKLVCVDDRFSKPIVLCRGENAAYKFIETIFEEYEYCKKVMKKHFNKKLIMIEKEEEEFQSSKTCWICEKRIQDDDEKVRDHCHITGKFRGASHWSCNINLQLNKKVPVIFHNLRGYDSHLIFDELNKFDVKIEVIPNRLEKYMTFF